MTAPTIIGKNNKPYCVEERLKPAELIIKLEAAGTTTKTIPCSKANPYKTITEAQNSMLYSAFILIVSGFEMILSNFYYHP
jgi:hypothetical protein